MRRSIPVTIGRHNLKKVDVEAKAQQMAEAAFRERPYMDEIALRHYLITEEARSGVPRNGHTTYQATYMETYRALQQVSTKGE